MQKMTGKKIRLIHLVEDLKIGGLERVVETLADRLDRSKYDVSIWCLAGGGAIADKITRKGHDLQILNLKTYHNPINILSLALRLRRHKVKVLHAHGYYASTMGRLAALLARVPIVLSHVHTVGMQLNRRNLWVERILGLTTDRVICCSEAVRDFMVSRAGIDRQRTVVIYNGVTCPRPLSRSVQEDKDNLVRIHISASLVENKGHRYLFEAFARIVQHHPNAMLSVAGDGPLKSDLLKYANDLGIGNRVEFLGLVDDIWPVVAITDICVLASVDREGLGIALIEAMCQGKPVIGTRVGGITEIIEDGVNGYLVPPKNVEALAGRLGTLINGKTARQRMGKAGYAKFREKFDANIMIGRIENAYDTLVAKKARVRYSVLYLHNSVNIGGGEQSLLNLWRNLNPDRYRLHLLIPSRGPLVEEARPLGMEVHYCQVPQLRPKNLVSISKTLATLSRICWHERIDIIHSYSPRNNVLSAVIGRAMGIPVIWHERNLVFGKETDISRRLWFLPNGIICNSKAVAERFRLSSGIPDRVRVALNGVDGKRFSPGDPPEAILKAYGLEGKRVVGLVSNLGGRKNPDFLLEAAPTILNRCPDVVFLFVGGEFSEDDKGRKQELTQRAESLGLRGHVVFTGFIPDPSGLIRTFDVGVAVTEREACSRAILEIMATGKPTVGFDTGGNPELIDDGVTGVLVSVGDISAFADAVCRILENKGMKQRMGRTARERMERCFDVKVNAKRTEAIYEGLVLQARKESL
ncbi:MAG: glycosyltransferase [Deltaproteobacteria bacterium]|nr:glycosyltransferase [Deltaproteobacteria bacterium]